MKRNLLLFIVLFSFLIANANIIEITIAYEDKEQPPYYMGNTSQVLPQNPGVAVEMVKLLEERIPELKINLIRCPWQRCLFELSQNTVAGIFNASYSLARLAIGWYPTVDNSHDGEIDVDRRITTITYSFYVLNDSKLTWNGSNFENLTGNIGAPLGYSVVNDLKSMNIPVEEAHSTFNNLDKLLAGRISAVALQDVTADDIINNNEKYSSIIKLPIPFMSKPYYLMLSHKFVTENPVLAQKIWDEIKNIRINLFDDLVKKYDN
jgi:polar amino acid transport system substrate-binding protein